MATITEDYVSFEIAKLLKERGFNKLCLYYYKDKVLMFSPFVIGRNLYQTDTYFAPTHQMAMKWLREMYDINIDVVSIWEQKRWEYQIYIITPTTSNCPYKDDTLYMTYEEAVEVALKYSLKNLV